MSKRETLFTLEHRGVTAIHCKEGNQYLTEYWIIKKDPLKMDFVGEVKVRTKEPLSEKAIKHHIDELIEEVRRK